MLEIQKLQVAYGATPVLKDVSLVVRAGEILAVSGPNGAGKTTLLRAISGALPIQSGSISLAGRDASNLALAERSRLIAVVPQARQLPAEFSVYDLVLFGRTPHVNWLGATSPRDHQITRQALELVHLSSLAQRRVDELSGGEQQRVLLARALAQEAPLMLLDEPITHLDLQHQSGLLNLVRRLAVEKGLAVLMVLHDLNLAGLFADRVVLLVEGAVHAAGAPAEVITAQNLAAIYHIPLSVAVHPDYGTPLVLPDGRNGWH